MGTVLKSKIAVHTINFKFIFIVIIMAIASDVIASKNQKDKVDLSEGILCQKDNIINTIPEVYDPINSKYGIDVSEFQGKIHWDTVFDQCVDFIFVRASEGITIQDKFYGKNMTALTEKELFSGPYHFYVIGDDPEKQISNFVSQIKSYRPPNLAPVVDIEETSFVYTPKPDKKEIQDALLKALKLVEEKTGCAPIVYTNLTFANKYLDNQLLAKYKLWLADYNKTPVTPNAWMNKGYSIHQYKTFNDFPGINSDSGKLDLNRSIIRDSSFEEEFSCEYSF